MNRGNRRGEFSPMREGNDLQSGNRAPRNYNNRPDFTEGDGPEEKLIILDPDIAEVFRNSDQVNKALRQLLTLARQVSGRSGGGNRPGARGNRRRRRNNNPGNNPNRPPKPTRMEGLPVDDDLDEE
ncbi:MAG: hypothetical protein FJY37_10205 [Betaproteobacteria bacterium]|nr:hypothetical protein [Betaproteobacteria bacterium]